MPADIGLNTQIAAVRTSIQSGASFADAVIALSNQLESTTNAFGTAALVNTGTSQGDIPLLETNGRLNPLRLPVANTSTAGAVELATNSETFGTDSTRAITSAGLSARTSTTTRTGLISLATPQEARLGNNSTKAMTPATTIAVGDERYLRVDNTFELLNFIWNGDVSIRPNAIWSTDQTISDGLFFPAADTQAPRGRNQGRWQLQTTYSVDGQIYVGQGDTIRWNGNTEQVYNLAANLFDRGGNVTALQMRLRSNRTFQVRVSSDSATGDIRVTGMRIYDD